MIALKHAHTHNQAESNMMDLISEYQQYQEATAEADDDEYEEEERVDDDQEPEDEEVPE